MPLAARSCHYQASGRRRRGQRRRAPVSPMTGWPATTAAMLPSPEFRSQPGRSQRTRFVLAVSDSGRKPDPSPVRGDDRSRCCHLRTCPAGQNAIADAVIRATQARRCVVWLMTRNASPAHSPGHRAPGTCPAGATSLASCTIPAGSEMPKPNTAPSRRGAARTSAPTILTSSPARATLSSSSGQRAAERNHAGT
jgi:hypothetical protein